MRDLSGEVIGPDHAVDRTSRIRTLPIRVAPLPEESLESWLEAIARRMSVRGAISCAPLDWRTRASEHGRDQGSQAHHVTPTERQWSALTAATGIDPSTARTMTVAALMSVPAGVPLPHSVCLPGSRFCPHCLAERDGRWRSWWWLRWGFACPSHGCLLVTDCPACGRSQRVRPHPRELIPDPGVCTRSAPSGGRTPKRCRQRLADAPAVTLGPDHPAVALQRCILAIIAAGRLRTACTPIRRYPVEAFFRDLAALGQRTLRYARTGGHMRPALQGFVDRRGAGNGTSTPAGTLRRRGRLPTSHRRPSRPPRHALRCPFC